jgi:hypothetical protein
VFKVIASFAKNIKIGAQRISVKHLFISGRENEKEISSATSYSAFFRDDRHSMW